MALEYLLRGYVGGAVETTLLGTMGTGDTSLNFAVGGGTGYPTTNFPIVVDYDNGSSEKMYVGTRSGDACTGLSRGQDGSTAKAHGNGAKIRHIGFAEDFIEANAIASALTTRGDSLWKGATPSVAPARLAAGADQQIIRYKAANTLGVETTFLGAIPVFVSTAARDTAIPSPGAGQACYINANTTADGLLFYNGTAWRQTSWSAPWGVLTAPVSVSSAQTGIGTALTDLTSLVTGSVVAIGNRYWRVSFRCSVIQQTSAGLVEITINTGASGAGTQLQSAQRQLIAAAIDVIADYVIVTPAAGATQYHLRGHTSLNTFDRNGSATQPATLLVEDLGPSGAPL